MGYFSIEAVAREWHENQKATWTEGYSKDILKRLQKNTFPFIGNRPIGEITPPELLEALRRTEARGRWSRRTECAASAPWSSGTP
jgi:integrase